MKLALPRGFWEQIESEARIAYPGECCGLIGGSYSQDTARALMLYPARNVAGRRDRFEIHPEDHFVALKRARADGQAITGCYHSHPNGAAQPSETDLAGGGEENFLWLVAALDSGDGPVTLAAFAYSAACFFPVEFLGPVGADFVRRPKNS